MMKLWEEAGKITLFGREAYRYGSCVAAGVLAAMIAIGILSWAKRCKRGTFVLTSLLCILSGTLCSRIAFCLMNTELGFMMPVTSWFTKITAGGWSMFGLICGVFAAAVISAKITDQPAGRLLDIVSCALPLFAAVERYAEKYSPDFFNMSRPLESSLLTDSFLTVTDDYGCYLATYKLAAIFSGLLFAGLFMYLIFRGKPGNTWLLFMILFGAGSVLLESLRYDRFMSITFVRLQQIMAMLMLGAGVMIPALRRKKSERGLFLLAVITLTVAVAGGVGIEFALDRTDLSKILLYVVFAAAVFAPAVTGILLCRKE